MGIYTPIIANWISLSTKLMTMYKVRKIMGPNFIGEAKVVEFLECISDTNALDEIPFRESTLIECKDTHILHPVYPFSILDLCQQFEGTPIGDLMVF